MKTGIVRVLFKESAPYNSDYLELEKASIFYGYDNSAYISDIPTVTIGYLYNDWTVPFCTRVITSYFGHYVSGYSDSYNIPGRPDEHNTFESVYWWNPISYYTYPLWIANLERQISNLNTSGESFPGVTDPQQQQVANLNKSAPDWAADEPQIDSSWFRSMDELKSTIGEIYGIDPNQVENLNDSIDGLNEFLNLNHPLASINGDISLGITLTSPPAPDDSRIEVSSYSGEQFVGDFNTPLWLGVFNNADGYVQADISIKNGTTVEASLTTRTSPYSFSRTIISSDLTDSRADFGSYTHGSGYTLDFTSSTFVGSRADGTYFGMSYDTIDATMQLKTSTETLVFVPQEVLSGARVPVTDTEKYGKLLYDIYDNGKRSLTEEERTFVQTKTLEIVQEALQNVSGITQSDINAIATSQSTNIISIGEGIINYTPPSQ